MNSELYYKNETTTSRNIGTIDSCNISKTQKENLIKNLENEKEINAKRVAEIHRYLFPALSDEIKNIYSALTKKIDELEKENSYLNQTHSHDLQMIDEVKGDSAKLYQENSQLKEQLRYLRSGEYLNQLRFERDMLQNIVDNGEVSKKDKEFIDMTHRNTELLEQLKQRDEVIDEALLYILNHSELSKININGLPKCNVFKGSIDELANILQKYKGDKK